MSRIICISNRVSLPDPETGEIKSGGLAVGVKAALKSNGGGIWFGWDGTIDNPGDTKRQVTRTERDNITFLTVPLTDREYSGYYQGMANECLWPLMHELAKHIEVKPGVFPIYKQVNRRFARLIKPHIRPGDVIWVHDYHLLPLGRELRALGIRNRIGYFNHIPMPSETFVDGPQIPKILKSQYRSLLGHLFFYDLVGFQSFRDFKNFSGFFGGDYNCPDRYKTVTRRHDGWQTAFGIFPISIDTHNLVANARYYALQNPHPPLEKDTCKTLIGAERLDYTKGLAHRMEGFYGFLDRHPQYRRKIKYRQITPLSRADIAQYKCAIANTRQWAKRIQHDFGSDTVQPLIYSEKGLPRDQLMGEFRQSDVGLVTPLIDGQNLVAKEYLAVQDARDPGMLILSKTAGAAEELDGLGVFCVDPTDPEDIAQKIMSALNTPRLERIEAYRRTIAHLYRYDIDHWAECFLNEISRTRKVQGYSARYSEERHEETHNF